MANMDGEDVNALGQHQITSPSSREAVESLPFIGELKHSHEIFSLLLPDRWLYEICSAFIGIISLVCVAVLLKVYDGKESPQWSGNITLNTVVSWLATICQTCLLMPTATSISQLCWVTSAGHKGRLQDVCSYDAASRGPWGSMLLVYRLKRLRLVTVGAVLTILFLGLGPFTQQTIQYESQSRPDATSQAKTVAAYAYTGASQDDDGFGPYATLFEEVPYNMGSAIYSGLLSSNAFSTPSPLFSCPSGNCTWDPFSTLVIGKSCTNISNSIGLNCTNRHYDGDSGQSCNFMSSTDPSWLQNYNATNLMSIRTSLPDFTLKSNVTAFFASVEWVKALDNIAHFPFSQSEGIAPYIQPNTTFEAMNCSFYYLVQQLNVSVSNGAYKEEVLNETINGQYDFSLNSTVGFPGVIFDPPFATEFSSNHSNFTVGGTQLEMLTSQFGSIFNGIVTAGDDAVVGDSVFIEMMWASSNMTQSLESMVTYMTNSLRGNDSLLLQEAQGNTSLIAPDQTVIGTVLVQRQIVIVHWAWLAFPVALAVGVLIFLIATIVVTSRAAVGIWKDSPLTLLFHTDHKGQIGSALESSSTNIKSADTADAMEKAASKVEMTVNSNVANGQIRLFSNSTLA